MKFYYESIDDATLTYTGTPATGYPVTNLQDRNETTLFRDTIGAATLCIEMDFGAAVTCGSLILGGVDGSATAKYVLQGASNDSFTTDVFNALTNQE